MILKTTTPADYRATLNRLTSEGFTQITNAILPNWIAGDNYIEVVPEMGVFALTSPERAERMGYNTLKL